VNGASQPSAFAWRSAVAMMRRCSTRHGVARERGWLSQDIHRYPSSPPAVRSRAGRKCSSMLCMAASAMDGPMRLDRGGRYPATDAAAQIPRLPRPFRSPPAHGGAAAMATSRMGECALIRDAHIGVLWEGTSISTPRYVSGRSAKVALTGRWRPRSRSCWKKKPDTAASGRLRLALDRTLVFAERAQPNPHWRRPRGSRPAHSITSQAAS